MNTFKKIAMEIALKQPVVVDNLLNDNDILSTIPSRVASHPMWNAYKERESIIGGGFVDLNEPLPVMSSTYKMKQTDLSVIGGTHFCTVDEANMLGGAEAYFNSETPGFLQKTGETAEKTIYKRFEDFAIANSSYEKTSASSGESYSMVIVRFGEAETIGLFSPVGVRTDGQILERTELWGGSTGIINSLGQTGYGAEWRGYFGLQMASTRSIAGIFNIQTGKIPTEEQIDDLLVEVRANGANTFIYCAPQVLSLLKKYKTDKLQMSMTETDIGKGILTWDGIRFVTSYNLGKEAFKTLS